MSVKALNMGRNKESCKQKNIIKALYSYSNNLNIFEYA